MTTFLFNAILLTAGSDKMAVADPHGFSLTLISVSVVFLALLILYGLYSLSGRILGEKPKDKAADDDKYTAALLALILEMESRQEESGRICMTKDHGWPGKSAGMRKKP